MDNQELRYIKYAFIEDGLRPLWAPHFKTEWIVYPDGRVNKKTIKLEPRIDEKTFMSNPDARIGRERRTIVEKEDFSVDPNDVQKLMNDIQSGMCSLYSMCDAYDTAKIFLMGGGTIEFNPAPYCLHEFFFDLDHKD